MSELTQRKKLKINANPAPLSSQPSVFPIAQSSFPTPSFPSAFPSTFPSAFPTSQSNPFKSLSTSTEPTVSMINPFNSGSNSFSTSSQIKFTHPSAQLNNPFNSGNSPFSSQSVIDQTTKQAPPTPVFPSISNNPFGNPQAPLANPFQRTNQAKPIEFKAIASNDFIPSFGPKVSQQKITNYFKIKTQPTPANTFQKSEKQPPIQNQSDKLESTQTIPLPLPTFNKLPTNSPESQNPFMSVLKPSQSSAPNPFMSSAGSGESKSKLLNKFVKNQLATINQLQKDSQQTSQGQKALTLKKSFSFGPSEILLNKQKEQKAQALKNHQLQLQREKAQLVLKQRQQNQFRQQLLNRELERVLTVVKQTTQRVKELAAFRLEQKFSQIRTLSYDFSLKTGKLDEVRRSKAKQVIGRLQKCDMQIFSTLNSKDVSKSLRRLLSRACSKKRPHKIDFRDIIHDQDQSPLQRQLVYFTQTYHTF